MIRRYIVMILSCLLVLPWVTSITAASGADIAGTGILSGQFIQKDKVPLANGMVFIYDLAMGPPSVDYYVRVPDHFAMLDDNGKFTMELPTGSYFISAVKKSDTVGPPAEGEAIYFNRDTAGKIISFVVETGKTKDIGIVSSCVPYKRFQNHPDKDDIVIEGKVADADGAAITGAVVYAYFDHAVQGKATYISEQTKKDGSFLLRVKRPGTYQLRVRREYGGGTPKDGEFVGINDPKELTSITVSKGQKLTGISIKVRHLERGPLYAPPQ